MDPARLRSGDPIRYNPGVSHYEKERMRFASVPFSKPSDRHDFEHPLSAWGNYCNENRELRRTNYTVPHSKLEIVREEAVWKGQFQASNGTKAEVIVWKGAVERLEIDAIVNAANETLLGGGGVDQAIHQAAGEMLVKECAHIKGGCEVGEAKMTKGYDLPANYVLHTVGPILIDNSTPDDEALKKCYESCIELCKQYDLKSVAFPCISCGFYGFPVERSAEVVAKYIKEECLEHLHKDMTIVLCVFDDIQTENYVRQMQNILGTK
ncbi:MAG: macro domain-containing protein [Chlamydiales bacterium]|nr:macro domain-containing protein [Chlamydiales bacterium]